MILLIFLTEALVASVAVCYFVSAVQWWWLAPIALGMFMALNVLYILFLLLVSLCLGKGENKREHPHIHRMTVRSVAWILQVLNIKVTLEGEEKLPNEPMVLVGNHRSDFDPMAGMVALSRRKLSYISKESNMRIPIAGPFVRRSWFLPLDRENPMRAARTLRNAAKLVRDRGYDMGIYPEGTRNRTWETGLLPFKEGAFMLAKWAGAPIALMSTEGTERIAGHVIFRRNHVRLRILEVISKEDVARMSHEELCVYAARVLSDALGHKTDAMPRDTAQP